MTQMKKHEATGRGAWRVSDGNLLDRDAARAELKRRLTEFRQLKGWSKTELVHQLELKGIPLGAGTVSQALNPERGTPAPETFDRLVEVLEVPAEDVVALRRLRDTAARGPDLLAKYLGAARRAAQEHPYAGVLMGATPPLAAVYLRQRVRAVPGEPRKNIKGLARQRLGVWMPGEEVLARDSSCVLLAGPGGGKSSLLRIALVASADQWLHDTAGSTVPVLVPAAELAARRPLPEAIAAAVTAELSPFGLLETIPPAFFARVPQPGSRWLLLVDGLDEITDPEGRRRVTEHLRSIAADADDSPYRFVVASRPPFGNTPGELGDAVPHFELRPFEPGELSLFAEQWFEKFGLPDPLAAASSFASTLKSAGLLELARTPLMATMLCQLRATAPDGTLPHSRGEVYERFVDLLQERQHASTSGGISAQTETALGRYGPDALTKAHQMIDHTVTLAAHLAAERYRGNTEHALSIVSAHPHATRPARVPQPVWTGFVTDLLRRSGVLTVQAGELTFLHQTLLEYLAARGTLSDRHASDRAFRELFTDAWSRRSPLSRKKWRRPAHESSYLGFLLDSWPGRGRATEPDLRRLAAQGGLAGCAFIADQKKLGTTLPESVVSTAAGKLQAMVRRADIFDAGKVDAALALTRLDSTRGPQLLVELATGSHLAGHLRVEAARRLATTLDDPRGRDILADLSKRPTDLTSHEARWRDKQAHIMATYFFDHPGREQLATMNYLHQVCGLPRVEAAATLGLLKDPRAADLLANLATGPDLDLLAEHRVVAAGFLAELGDPRCHAILVNIATDPAHWGMARVTAAKGLLQLGHARAREILEGLANDPELEEHEQARARKHLTRHWG
ncbi:NACHT domain-containing protein [Streptomyces sp. NPDC101225]|uniref:NACHT domain-containing protein n=1 Tax=Streptomyces sp. NPDC101225 TaxID=3366135 RepID=UPI00381F7187